MKKKYFTKKAIVTTLITIIMLLMCTKTYAKSSKNIIKPSEYTEEYTRWTQLTAEEKDGLIEPRMYDIPKATVEYSNPLKFAKMLGSTVLSEYSLIDYIPENMMVRNQQDTNTCWAFAALGMLDKTQMKEHIKSYGGIMSSIHGTTLMSDCYNKETGAIYCYDNEHCQINHSVIIGWDDNYDKNNFNKLHKPTNNGA